MPHLYTLAKHLTAGNSRLEETLWLRGISYVRSQQNFEAQVHMPQFCKNELAEVEHNDSTSALQYEA